MVNRNYFEAKFLVDADQLERMMGKKLPDAADKLQSKLTKTSFGQAFRQAGKDSEAFYSRLGETGKKLESTGKKMTLVGAAVVALGYKAVQSASDMYETQNKVDVVFGKSAGTVEAFGKTAAQSIGESEQQADEAAATFGNLFLALNIGQKPAAQMSTTLVRLAGDLASFNNADPTEVLQALESGLTGQVRPLRQFGVNLQDATLRAEAMRLQLGKIGPTLTPQQRTLAAYSLILKQTKTAQGDFARTSGGLANQERITTAEFKDASAALGKDFLPIALELVHVARSDIIPTITKMGDFFAKLPKPVKEVGLAALVAIGPLTYLTGKILSGIATLGKARAAWTLYRAAKLAQIPTDAAVATAEEALAVQTTAAGAAATTAGTGAVAASAGFGALATKLGLFGAAAAAGAYSGSQFDDQLKHIHESSNPLAKAFDWLNQKTTIHIGKTNEAAKATQNSAAKTSEYTLAVTDMYPELDVATAKQIASTATSKDAALQYAKSAEATKAAAKALDEYDKQLDQTKATIAGVIPSFEGYKRKSDVTAAGIVKNLKQEVGGYTTWATDVQRLLKRGADPQFILELSQKGPAYLHAMAGASDKELALSQRYFNQRMKLIHDISVGQLRLTGVEAPRAFAAGLQGQKPAVSKAAQAIAAAATNPLKLHNVAATLGREAGAGLAGGINSKASRQAVSNSAAALSLLVKSKTKAELGIKSPSTIMFHYGELWVEGLVKGIQASMPGLTAAAAGAGRGGAVALGKAMAAQRGWVGAQWAALYQLWQHESGWNPMARNPSSGAFGIPQALPPGKMGAAAVAGNAAAQIAWGLDYIASVYGSPSFAWSMWQSRSPHWYGKGLPPTVFTSPTLIGVGERGAETVSVTRGRTASGGDTYNFDLRGAVIGDRQAFIRMVRDGIRDAQRRSGVPAKLQIR